MWRHNDSRHSHCYIILSDFSSSKFKEFPNETVMVDEFSKNLAHFECYYYTLQWRHNKRDCVSNHHRLDCLINRLFRQRSKKTPKLRVTGLCEGNSPVTGEFPGQRVSNEENDSIWWRHHDLAALRLLIPKYYYDKLYLYPADGSQSSSWPDAPYVMSQQSLSYRYPIFLS